MNLVERLEKKKSLLMKAENCLMNAEACEKSGIEEELETAATFREGARQYVLETETL